MTMKTKQMSVKNNKLYMGPYSLEELGKKYGTPLYIYDEEGIRERISDYKNSFCDKEYDTHIVYATKAFLAPYLCNLMSEYGIWADAVSMGDMYLLKKAGFDSSHIVLHGNNKSLEELKYAIDLKVGYIVVDNVSELKDLVNLTKDIQLNIPIMSAAMGYVLQEDF